MLAAELASCLARRSRRRGRALRAWLSDFEDRGELQVTDGARRVLDLFLDPPEKPTGARCSEVSRLAFGTLPDGIREMYGVPFGPVKAQRCARRSHSSGRGDRCSRRSTGSSPRTRSSCCRSRGIDPEVEPRGPGSGSASGSSVACPSSWCTTRAAVTTAGHDCRDRRGRAPPRHRRRARHLVAGAPRLGWGHRCPAPSRRAVPAPHEHHDAHVARAGRDASRGRFRLRARRDRHGRDGDGESPPDPTTPARRCTCSATVIRARTWPEWSWSMPTSRRGRARRRVPGLQLRDAMNRVSSAG